jgi:tetraacyldisaccharide 4'-kinase
VKAPAFWSRGAPGLLAHLLSPIGAIYGALTLRRMKRQGLRLDVPVIAIGNFTAGGAGKTPTAIAIGKALKERGHRPVFVTRGYGGSLAGPVLVDPARHKAADCGDEPLLLARTAPVIVSRDRAAGGKMASGLGDIVILDDALQNPDLVKDITIAVIDAGAGFGNGKVIPAGPLRAPFQVQLPFVDYVLIIGETGGTPFPFAVPVAHGKIHHGALLPDLAAIAALRGKRLFAFAGIGRPEKFFDHLRALGCDLAGTRTFADHHPYSAEEIAGILHQAKALGAVPVTTEKDAVRIAAGSNIAVLPVSLEAPGLIEDIAVRLRRRAVS